MRILRVEIQNFRGFSELVITPRAHVMLGGEPRAGRSTVVEALRRALDPDATRTALLDDLDFRDRDTSKRIEVEVVLGDLGAPLEQEFFDQLEPWDAERQNVAVDTQDPTELDDDGVELVVRLCYRAEWSGDEELAEHWVDFPKSSDPSSGHYARVPRRLLQALPCIFVDSGSRPLRLSARSDFRALVDSSPGDDFSEALAELMREIEAVSEDFSNKKQVAAALAAVLDPLRRSLGIGKRAAPDVVGFLPEGGSLAGTLRSLGPSLDLGSGVWLPLERHGSSTSGMLRLSEALALANEGDGSVVIADDFGEDVEVATATHLAATYRKAFDQVWLSTRHGQIGEVFSADELVRLIRARKGSARIHVGRVPATRAERIAARHVGIQLLPAISSRTLVVLEGPHDRAALSAVSLRQLRTSAEPLLAATSIALVDAGAADRSGGATAAVKLAAHAVDLGFRVVTVLDGDKAGDDAESEAAKFSHAVIRLPKSQAIERVLVEGIDGEVLVKVLKRLADGFGVHCPPGLDSASPDDLRRTACDMIKSSGGLHAQYVELLPMKVVPPVAVQVLVAIREAATGRRKGVIAL